MATPITDFKNIKIASNESIDYYALNRAFNKIYDVATIVSGNVNTPYTGSIPYATLNSPGFVQFTATSAVSGISDNKIISADTMYKFINSESLSATATSSFPAVNPQFFLTSGGGQLLNNVTFQYGYTVAASATYTDVQTRVLTVPFVTTGYMAFTHVPHLVYQLMDADVNRSFFTHQTILSSIAVTGFNIIIHTQQHAAYPIATKSEFYLTWLAIGV